MCESSTMNAIITLVVLALLRTLAAAHFVCGGHTVTGVAILAAAADVDRSALLDRPLDDGPRP